jgi:hypothetical protein
VGVGSRAVWSLVAKTQITSIKLHLTAHSDPTRTPRSPPYYACAMHLKLAKVTRWSQLKRSFSNYIISEHMGLRVDKLCWLTRPNPLLLIDLA